MRFQRVGGKWGEGWGGQEGWGSLTGPWRWGCGRSGVLASPHPSFGECTPSPGRPPLAFTACLNCVTLNQGLW